MIPSQILSVLREKRKWNIQHAVCVLNTVSVPAHSYCTTLEKYAPGWGANLVVLIAGKNSDDVYWVVDEDHIAEIIRDTEIHKEKVTRLFRLWSKKVEKFYEFCNSLKVDSSDFISKFPAFLGLYLEEYGIAMLADHYAVGGDIIFEKIARKYPDAVEHAKCLIKPDRLTFLMKEELGFLEILNKWKKEIKSVSNYDSCSPKLKTEINNHQKKYFWIENGYKYVKVLKPEYFFERLKKLGNFKKRLSELRDYGKDTRRRKKLAEKSFNKNDVSLLRQLGLVGWWHDQRKRANLIGLHYHHLFIQKMAEKIGENPETLGYLSAVEFKKLILRRKIDFKDIKKRKNGFAYVLLKGSSEWVGVGEEYKFVQKALLGQSVKKAETLNGLCASPGFAKGKARIILNPHSEKLNEGEILVTFMTRPEFVPLMKHATAILTQEGGISSHAAIISREMKKPCIVGIRDLTRILKTGDLIEVDATKGIVRKIK